jgi:hypothetical protein
LLQPNGAPTFGHFASLYFRDDPRIHTGVTPEEIATLPPPRATESSSVPWWPLLKRMLPVTFTDFCYGWTLWVYLSWLPSFFLHNYHLNLKQSALFSSGVLFAGVVGDTVGGVFSDQILRRTGSARKARVLVIFIGFYRASIWMRTAAAVRL